MTKTRKDNEAIDTERDTEKTEIIMNESNNTQK